MSVINSHSATDMKLEMGLGETHTLENDERNPLNEGLHAVKNNQYTNSTQNNAINQLSSVIGVSDSGLGRRRNSRTHKRVIIGRRIVGLTHVVAGCRNVSVCVCVCPV